MRIDELVSIVDHGWSNDKPVESKDSITQFSSKLPLLAKLLPLNILKLDCIIIAKRDSRLTTTVYIHKDKLKKLFAYFKKNVPYEMVKLYKYTKWFLVDIDSLETDTIRFYVPFVDLDYSISNQFPFDKAINEMQKHKPYDQLELLGFYVKEENIIEYKYYFTKSNQIYNYRFRNGNFISKHTEHHKILTRKQMILDLDFGYLFDDIDTSKIIVNLAERQDVDQRYISISDKSDDFNF